MADENAQNCAEASAYKPFEWTAEREQAALLFAENELTDVEIAARVNVCRRTLYIWKEHQEFKDRITAHVKKIGSVLLRHAIAKPARRIAALNARWNKMHQVIEERAADPDLADIPGGKTGLLVRQTKGIGTGKNFQVVEEYAVDTGLLKLMNDTERQAAQECGQWLEKTDITTSGEPITLVKGVPDEVL